MSTVQNYKNPTGTYNKNQYNKDFTTRVNAAQNIYTEEFKSFLQRVQDQYPTTLRQIPLDQPRIQVYLNSRFIDIKNSEYKDYLSMAEDHRAETVYFEVDRYFEDVDLFNCTCIIEYINGGGHPRIYPVTLKDLYKDMAGRDKMILAWNIGNEATLFKGEIQFSLTFYKTSNTYNDQDGTVTTEIIYALHTTPATGTILFGMEYSDLQEIERSEVYSVSNYEALLALINQKLVYWNDL